MDYTEQTRLHAIVKREFAKHRWETFVDEPPSMARGGRVVVVPGCSICRVRLQTVGQFTDHLCEKVEASHPIPVWNGLLEHRRKIGAAVWEFMWCLDAITLESRRGIMRRGYGLGRSSSRSICGARGVKIRLH